MSAVVEIPRFEQGVVRVFDLALDGDEASDFAANPARIAESLGLDGIDPDYARVFPLSDVEGIGLTGYLTEGLGVASASLDRDRARLEGLTGYVAILTSRAFGQDGATLTPRPPLSLIGTYGEDRMPVNFTDLPSAGAIGTLSGPVAPPSPVLRGGRLGLWIAVCIILAALVALAVF